MTATEIRLHLIKRLKQDNCLWSYNHDSVQSIPDDMLVELVMLYLDIDDINQLFSIMTRQEVKRAWIKNVVSQGERYYQLNTFYAWYYFNAKKPLQYVKSMSTKMLNKKLSA
jgi:hypothetical protein